MVESHFDDGIVVEEESKISGTVYPTFSIVSCNSAGDVVGDWYRIVATWVVRLTTASNTPGDACRARVMALEHMVHVMPPMTMSIVFSLVVVVVGKSGGSLFSSGSWSVVGEAYQRGENRDLRLVVGSFLPIDKRRPGWSFPTSRRSFGRKEHCASLVIESRIKSNVV